MKNWRRLGMKSEWTKKKLSDIADFNPRETIKKGAIAKKIPMDVLRPFYRDIPYYVEECFSGGTKFRNGDTIMARITPCLENGKTAQVSILNDGEVGFGSTEYIVFRAKEGIADKDYLYYLVCSPEVREPAIKSMVGSSGRQRVQTDVVKNLEIDVPPLVEQEKIGSFLKAFDDKIALNDRINKNLEQQAQAIFDDMFPDIFSLNTDATLQDLIVFSNGQKRPKTIGNIPVYGGNGILAYTDKSNADNCVIIGRVGAYCGNTFLCLDKCWTSDNAIQAKSRTGSSPLFIYYLLRNASLSSRHIGTGQPLMTQGILNAIPIKYPVEEKISAFIETCSPIHKMISGNRQQNESLASIRDSMLPKLMSGEMDVSELNL